jgi:Restriction endonuclease
MKRSGKSWEVYERMIARMIADQSGTDVCVTANARIIGKISGRSRQIDVLMDARHDTDNTRRVIVDAKKRRRKIDVTDVEALLGVMVDVGATHGYLVSPSGFTKAAEKRAQMEVSIRIVPVDRLENFDPSTWPKCKVAGCGDGRVFWDGYPELSMKLRPMKGGEEVLVLFLHYVGKCDRCGMFHVWCTRCDEILAVPTVGDDDIGHQCRCKLPWFWLGSIETDEAGNESAELHAVIGAGKVMTVDRRALRHKGTASDSDEGTEGQ